MTESLSKSAQSVQESLLKHGLQCKVIELAASTRTAQEAATALNCTVAQIVKSLIFRTLPDNQPILVLASGVNRVNEKAVAAIIGKEIAKADADFTRSVTGFAIGGIPPAGHTQKITTYIDQDLLKLDELWAAAGTPHAVFKLHARDLPRITQGTIISIV
jgi:prolyl-tRNA editing enzyme YbaK/EbsC (Cys-tRNA(Pro) deacylase)